MDGAPPDMDTMDTMDRMDNMDTKDRKATGRAGGRAMDNGRSQGNERAAVATVTAYHGCPSAASAALAARCCPSFVLARPHPSLTSFSSLSWSWSLASFQARLLQRSRGSFVQACP